MPATLAHQAQVAPNLLLDGRLALVHETERWLAVADLHFGYELSQRAAGRLVPLWGMASVEKRLLELLDQYRPRRLIIAGDVIHDGAGMEAAGEFLKRLQGRCEVIALEGNHDCRFGDALALRCGWETPEFVFRHGHCGGNGDGRIEIIGHHHPAASLRDGAGLRLKCPAFVQQERCWILPAFSPWAGGVVWPEDDESRIWLCTPGRVLRVDRNRAEN